MGKLFGKKKKEPEVTVQPQIADESVTVQVSSQPPNYVIGKRLSYHIANLQGIGARQNQEDSFAFANATDVNKIIEKGLLAIVADGMGGMNGGKLASETTVSIIRDSFNAFDYSADLSDQLCETLTRASDDVYQKLGGMGGSTAIVCLFYNEKLYFASAGDSILYLKRGDRFLRLNREHNVYNSRCYAEAKAGNISKLNEADVPEAVALTQFIGMDVLDDIDRTYKPLKLKEGDIILMASDGVETINEAEIIDCLKEPTPAKMCTKMESMILGVNKRFQDNYTALIIRCE